MTRRGYVDRQGERTVKAHPALPISIAEFLHKHYGMTDGINNSMSQRVVLALNELKALKGV